MKIALALLCFSAVAFMLRVLFALVLEAMHAPHGRKFYLARLDHLRQDSGEPKPYAVQELQLTKGSSHGLAFETSSFPVPLTNIAQRWKQGSQFNLRRL